MEHLVRQLLKTIIMTYNNNTYVILNWSEIIDENSTIDFSKLLNINAESLRKNSDNTKAIVKYSGSQPSFLNGKTTYSHSEILTEIDKASWDQGGIIETPK